MRGAMHQRWIIAPLLASVLALSACQKADNEPGPGGLTVGEAKALDRAAAMIEDQAPPPVDQPVDQPGQTPSDTPAGQRPHPTGT